jgi:hypothetical protein
MLAQPVLANGLQNQRFERGLRKISPGRKLLRDLVRQIESNLHRTPNPTLP